MANIFNNIVNIFKDKNKFNRAFVQGWGVSTINYDENNETYLDKGYNFNSVVYSIISKQASKTASIPLLIKKVEDDNAKNRLNNLHISTKGDLTPIQKVKKRSLERKAYSEEFFDLPLEKPNASQTWVEFHTLFKIFMKTTGNFYVYEVSPEDGMNKGVPTGVYILPSHQVQIVLKKNTDLLDVTENPIDYYILLIGDQWVKFESEKVYHIKYANPNYDENGEHLYGLSPLRAALRNLQSSNSAVDSNIKILLNNGAFGFLFGKGAVLNEPQVKAIKDRIIEMDNDPSRLGKLGALSAEVGFQRISLTTDELKPFDYLDYDQKQLCNVLGYDDKLLNNDSGAKYDNVNIARKAVVTDDIKPDLQLLENGFWKPFLAKFKGYDNVIVEYDISELPEMQEDMVLLAEWTTKLADRGYLNGDEVRNIFTFPSTGLEEHKVYTTVNDVLTLEEAIESNFNVNEPIKE